MGNALHAGDGLTVAEMSVMESYYSGIGMTSESRTTTDDNSASVVTTPLLNDIEENDERNGGGGLSRQGITSASLRTGQDITSASLHQGNKSTKSSSRIANPSNLISAAERQLPQHYGTGFGEEADESRTETSSAYHHGYRMGNERREERENIEFRDDGGRYGFEHALNYSHNRSPQSANAHGRSINPIQINNNSSRKQLFSHHDSRHLYRSVNDLKSNNSSLPPRRHLMSKLNSRQDSKLGEASERDAVATVADILPAETDMAYVGSEDEEEAQAIRDKEITSRYAVHQEEEVVLEHARLYRKDPPQRDEESRRSKVMQPSLAQDTSESLQHQQRAQLLLQESRHESLIKQQQAAAQLLQSQEESLLRQQQAAAQLLLQGELARSQEDSLLWWQHQLLLERGMPASQQESLLRQQQAAAQLLLREDLRESSDHSLLQQQQAARLLLQGGLTQSLDESLLRQQRAHQLLHGDETLHSDSFSTLTKTLDTLPPPDEGPVMAKNEKDKTLEKEAQASPTPTPAPVVAPAETPLIAVAEKVAEDEDGPAQRKLEELLQQQEVQEEKLQKQLEQLRVQKGRLQQLQEEKKRSTMTTMPSQEGSNMENSHHQGSLQARNEELRIQKDRMRAVKADISLDGSSQYFRNSMETARQEQTRRQRLERARQKVMPKSLKDAASSGKDSKLSESGSRHKSFPQREPQNSMLEGSRKSGSKHQSVRRESNHGPDAGQEKTSHEEESSTGTATGEMDVSFPEYDDVPSQFGINHGEPGPFEENDMTTISASLTDDLPDDASTISSMKDGQGLDDEEQDNIDALHEASSSIDEEIDLDFVAKYDTAFNTFLDTYPALFDGDSELIQNLKVAKLQRILEVSYQTETDLEAQLEAPGSVETSLLEADFQQKLKEASRRKAERSIQLKTELNQIKKQSRALEAKLTWDMLLLSVNRAKKLHKIKKALKSKELISTHDLLACLPDTNLMREVIKAVEAKPRASFEDKEKMDLQQYQVDNAFLNAEAKVLQKKVAALAKESGRQEDLDGKLVKIDSKQLKKLRSRFQKKLGASF